MAETLDNWQTTLAAMICDYEDYLSQAGDFKRQKDAASKMEREAREKADNVRAAILEQLESAGVLSERVNGWLLSMRSGRVSLVDEGADVDDLAIDMVRIKREPDKAAIQAALARGETVPGYRLEQSGPSLSITPPKGT